MKLNSPKKKKTKPHKKKNHPDIPAMMLVTSEKNNIHSCSCYFSLTDLEHGDKCVSPLQYFGYSN